MSDFGPNAMMMLGEIRAMVMDLREEAPKQNEAIQRLGDRTGAIERQMMSRHRENSSRLDVLQTALDAIKAAMAPIEARLSAVEKPVSETTDRKIHRRKWIMRGVQIVAGITTTVMLFVEPAGKVVIEFYTRRFLDRP